MSGFANTDHVSDLMNWKSIYGYVFTISGSMICFNSTIQRSFAGFTIKAKYIVLSLAFQQAI